MAISDHKDFGRMMDAVRILRTHYSTIANMAEQEMLKAQIRGQGALAQGFKTQLDQMARDHDAALSVIANQLTTVEQLQATRRALRAAADTAHKFIGKLKKAKVTLDKITEAADFLAGLVTDLRRIF